MALATALGLLFIAGLFSRFVDATWTAQGDTSSHSVTFSTFFGGSDLEFAQGITVDSLGNIYMVGGTRSSDFPVTRQAFQSIRKGDADAFLAKLSADGSRVLWSTLLGGSAKDYAHGVFVDEQGHVYVTGVTLSRDFPTTGHAYQRNLKGNKDVFVAKFARDGSLVFSTLVGGSGGDGDRGEPYADGAGNVYVATATESPDFPTTAGVLQRKLRGTRDVAVFVLSPDGSRLQRSCLFGGSGFDDPWGGIHVYSDGSIYVSGSTTSKDLPTTSAAFQRAYGGGTGEVWIGDSFVTRLSSDCSKLIYSGYLGGEGDDRVSENHGMAVDGSGRAIIAGHTNSKRFPITEKALQKSFGGGTYDGFVAAISADGSALEHSSYLGGSANDLINGVAVDKAGNVYLTGSTASADFPATSEAGTCFGVGKGAVSSVLRDAYRRAKSVFRPSSSMIAVKLAPDLGSAVYSTCIGESRGRALALARSGEFVILGDTSSSDFPTTPSAIQPKLKGNQDLVVVKFSPP